MSWSEYKKKPSPFQKPKVKGCIVCGQPAPGKSPYCYWCGKRRGLW